MNTMVDMEDTMVVVVMVDIMVAESTVDIMVGTIMRVMAVIIMGVTEVIMEEEDMVDTTAATVMEGEVATADITVAMEDTITEGTDTILVVLVLAMVTDTHPSDTKPGEQRQETV